MVARETEDGKKVREVCRSLFFRGGSDITCLKKNVRYRRRPGLGTKQTPGLLPSPAIKRHHGDFKRI